MNVVTKYSGFAWVLVGWVFWVVFFGWLVLGGFGWAVLFVCLFSPERQDKMLILKTEVAFDRHHRSSLVHFLILVSLCMKSTSHQRHSNSLNFLYKVGITDS